MKLSSNALVPMTLTLDLPPQLETLLRQRAETTGQDVGQIANAVLSPGGSTSTMKTFLNKASSLA